LTSRRTDPFFLIATLDRKGGAPGILPGALSCLWLANMTESAQHILICFHDFNRGGTERIALGMAKRWLDQGRRVTILCGARMGAGRYCRPAHRSRRT
jgi:hypothetical protein